MYKWKYVVSCKCVLQSGHSSDSLSVLTFCKYNEINGDSSIQVWCSTVLQLVLLIVGFVAIVFCISLFIFMMYAKNVVVWFYILFDKCEVLCILVYMVKVYNCISLVIELCILKVTLPCTI